MNPSLFAIATMDTKAEELAFVAHHASQSMTSRGFSDISVLTVDVGTATSPLLIPDVSREMVFGDSLSTLSNDRGEAITQMSAALGRYLMQEYEKGNVRGVIGIGGSGGTALITSAMRTLPIGLPKLMVSTVASGNTAPYVDCSDITMMYSVVDVAGLNAVSRQVLANAAHAIAGMVSHDPLPSESKSTLGMTMFGVTTPCVNSAREQLENAGYDCLVFHATGTGGRAMEKLVDTGFINGVLDLTTTEVADRIAGGIFPAGEDRFEATLRQRVPLVLSLGALDMVNFGPIDSVPERYRSRNLLAHNAQVTLMRTSADECSKIGKWIAQKLNRSTSPLQILIPEMGVSSLDAPGEPFYDPEIDAVLFQTLESALEVTGQRQIERIPMHINDPEFSSTVTKRFQQLIQPVKD